MAYKQLKDKEWLIDQYVKQQKSMQTIADELGCHKTTVHRAMDILDIPRRPRTSKYPKLNNKDWLRRAYVEEGRSLNDIASEVNTSPGNIADHLKTMGIERRSIKAGIRLAQPDRSGENHPNWKGGKYKTTRSGYVYERAPDHPRANNSGYVREHILVAEKTLGRYLRKNEIVHHIDGNKSNNDPSNLEVLTRSEHVMRHFEAVKVVRKLRHRVQELEAENARLQAEIERLKDECS